MILNPKCWSCTTTQIELITMAETPTTHHLSTQGSKIQTSPKQSLFLTIICSNFCGFPVGISLLELAVHSEQWKCVSPVLAFISLAPSTVCTFLFFPQYLLDILLFSVRWCMFSHAACFTFLRMLSTSCFLLCAIQCNAFQVFSIFFFSLES